EPRRVVASRCRSLGHATRGDPTWPRARGLRGHRQRRAPGALAHAGGRGGEERGQGMSRRARVAAAPRAAPRVEGARLMAFAVLLGALAVIAWVYVGYPVVLGMLAWARR